jgi:hypothetical protein
MTWDLAESSKHFVTTIVNRNDVVPSLGRASAMKLRTEVPLCHHKFIYTGLYMLIRAESGLIFDKLYAHNIFTITVMVSQVMASSWVHDLRDQIQQTRFLGFTNHSVSFIRSHVPFISNPRSKVVNVDMLQSHSSKV